MTDHECTFAEEQEPDGRLILVPCLECGCPAIEGIKYGKELQAKLQAAERLLRDCRKALDNDRNILMLRQVKLAINTYFEEESK